MYIRSWKTPTTTRPKMNRQGYSILFCVLFASTLIHEIRAKAAANPEYIALPGPIILPLPIIITPPGAFIRLNVTVEVPNTLTICNGEANVYLLIDVVANRSILLNGNQNTAVIIDLKTKGAVYIENINCQDFLNSVENGLESALALVGGDITGITEKALKAINDMVISLVANIGVELNVNLERGLNLIIDLSKGLIVLLTGDLKGLVKHLDSDRSLLYYEKDLVGLTNFLIGLGKCVKRIPGGIATVYKRLNLQALLRLDNGLEILLSLLGQLGELSRSLTFLNDLENYFVVVALFGGLQNGGISGLTRVLSTVLRSIKGKVTLEVLVTVLIQDLAWWHHSKPVPDANKVLHRTANSILSLLKKLGLTSEFRGFVTHLNSLLGGTLIFEGVNLSAIITSLLKVLTGKSSSVLQILVGVLLQLKPVVTNEVVLVRGLLTILFHLTTDIGRHLLWGFGFFVESILGFVGDVVPHLVTLAGNIQSLLLENLYEALLKIPTIGDIVKLLAADTKSVSGGKLDLKSILNNPSLRVWILGFIQLETHLPLKITANIILQIEVLWKSSTSLDTYVNYYPDVLGPHAC